jgi:hypothetical protein
MAQQVDDYTDASRANAIGTNQLDSPGRSLRVVASIQVVFG